MKYAAVTWTIIAAAVALPIVAGWWVCWLTAKAREDDLSPDKEKVTSHG